MKRASRFVIALALMVAACLFVSSSALAESPAILEVTSPRQLTTDSKYDQNPSFFRAIDGAYWVFFGRGRGNPSAPGYNPNSDYYDICYVRSKDDGLTWGEDCLPALPAGHGDGAPTPAAFHDGIGKIWVFYAARGVGVYYFTSDDNGVSWNGPTLVVPTSDENVQNHMDAIVAADGKIWIFYRVLELPLAVEASAQLIGNSVIYARNFDSVTWSGRILVANVHNTNTTPRALQDAATGAFHVVFASGGPWRIYLTSSMTNGISWTTPTAIVNTMHVDAHPALVKHGSTWRLFFAPFVGADDHQWLMMQSSTDLAAWTTPITVTAASYDCNMWWDFWPEAGLDGSALKLFYASLKDGSQRDDDADIFMFDVNWDLTHPHYEAIQPGVDAAASPDIVNVGPGLYKENVLVNKPVILNGPNVGRNPNTMGRLPEAIVVPEFNDTAAGDVFHVVTDTVTIDGFTIDGDNADLGGGVSLNGADGNALAGVANNPGPVYVQNIVIRNNIIKNLIRGVYFSGLDIGSSGNYIEDNLFDNIPSASPLGRAILIPDCFYAQVSGNVMTRVYVGIQADDFHCAGSPALIQNNHIQSYRLGIWLHDHYASASSFTVQGNVLTTVPGATSNVGLWLTSIRDTVTVNVLNNNVSGAQSGIEAWNLSTSTPVVVGGGVLNGNTHGVWHYNYSTYSELSGGAPSASQLTLSGVSIQNSTTAGVRVQDHTLGTKNVTVDVQNGTMLQGNTAGGLTQGSQTDLNITDSTLTGNTTAVDVNGGSAVVTNSFVNGNGVGVLVRASGNATVNYNDLSGNTGLAVNHLMGALTNASGNWLGSNLQPNVAAQCGASVDYTPWLDVGTDTSPAVGFQPDLSVLWVDDDSPQSGGQGRITEGVNMVAGSTVHVLPGTYNETLTFGTAFNKDNVTVLGDAGSRPIVTGGVKISMNNPITGLTLRNLYFKGDAGANKVINCTNSGANNNFTLDNCAIDGENVAGRHGLAGNRFANDFTVTWCEFKDLKGWAALDVNFGFGATEQGDRALATVTFANNSLHDCRSLVALRGLAAAKTRIVYVNDNVFANIGNNNTVPFGNWAALIINYANDVRIYNNYFHHITHPSGGRADALQLWKNDAVDIHSNRITTNWSGIYFPGGTYAGDISGVEVHGNVICGNGQFGLRAENDHIGIADAEGNWWGTDTPGPSDVQGPVDYDPWITRSINANPPTIVPTNGSGTVEVTYTTVAGYTVPDGHVITWTTTLGSVAPVSSTTSAGVASTTLTGPGSQGTATVTAHDGCSSLNTSVQFRNATRTPTGTATATPTDTPTPTPTPTCTETPLPITTITIQNGILGTSEDTHIDQYSPTSNHCTEPLIRVGYGQRFSGLLRFDLALIPPAVNIVSAHIELYTAAWSGSGASISMGPYAVLRPVVMCQATWNQYQAGLPWGAAGCNDTVNDRRPTPESTAIVNAFNQWFSFDVTSLVQQWVNGTLANNGVLLRGTTDGHSFYFASSDHGTTTLHPKLVVVYGGSPPPPPTPSPTPTATATHTLTPIPGAETATPTLTPTLTPTPGGGGPITIQKGTFGDSEDTYIYRYQNSANYYTSNILKVGYQQAFAGLVRFDLSPIPPGATIDLATLELWASAWSGADMTCGVYAIVRTVNLSQATWSNAQTGVPWGVAGCNDILTDRRGSPESSLTTSGPLKWYAWNVTNLVQEWVDGTLTNNGVLLRATFSTSSFRFASNEDVVNLRPKLVVTYH